MSLFALGKSNSFIFLRFTRAVSLPSHTLMHSPLKPRDFFYQPEYLSYSLRPSSPLSQVRQVYVSTLTIINVSLGMKKKSVFTRVSYSAFSIFLPRAHERKHFPISLRNQIKSFVEIKEVPSIDLARCGNYYFALMHYTSMCLSFHFFLYIISFQT